MEIYGIITFLGLAVYVVGPWVPATDATLAACNAKAVEIVARAPSEERAKLDGFCAWFPTRPQIDRPLPEGYVR